MSPNRFILWSVLAVLALQVRPLAAMPELLASTRSVAASGSDSLGNSWSQSFTTTTFDDFNQVATANGASVRMNSTLSTSAFDYHVAASGYLDGASLPSNPGGPPNWTSNTASSLFTLTFRLDAPTAVTFTGVRDNATLGGLVVFTVDSGSGPVSLTWHDAPYFNYLDQTLLLGPDTYTLTGRTELGYVVSGSAYDGGAQLLNLGVRLSTPEAASTAGLLVLGAMGVGVGSEWRRRRQTRGEIARRRAIADSAG